MIAAKGQAITALLPARQHKGSRSNAITGFGRWLRSDDCVTVRGLYANPIRAFCPEGRSAGSPNPSTVKLTITSVIPQGSVNAKVYDLLGRGIYNKQLSFSNNQASINLDANNGIYILEIKDAEGEVYRQKVEVRK